ncbi:Cytokinin riboside 5'-monophosphate phosphoribohydrolase LOG5, partial [Cucurbita argyrosperma subsp. sororia]
MEGKVVKSRFKRVCVFCGSSTGKRDCYRDATIDLAQELVSRRLGLVYGGGSIGLMGLVSQAVHRGGGRVMGIIPRTLMNKELGFDLPSSGWLAERGRLLQLYLLTFIDQAVDDGFIKPSQRNIIVSAPNAKDLVQKTRGQVRVNVPIHDEVMGNARCGE